MTEATKLKLIGTTGAVVLYGLAAALVFAGHGSDAAVQVTGLASAASGLLGWVWLRRPGDAPPEL